MFIENYYTRANFRQNNISHVLLYVKNGVCPKIRGCGNIAYVGTDICVWKPISDHVNVY